MSEEKAIPDVLEVNFKDRKVISKNHKVMTPAQISDKAELIMLTKMMELSTRQARKAFAQNIGISWKEYQYLKFKWKHLIKRVTKVGKQLAEKELDDGKTAN